MPENLIFGLKSLKNAEKHQKITFSNFLFTLFNPRSAVPVYIRHGLYRRAKPSCDAQFELEIVIFSLTRRNWIVLHGQAKDNLKVSLSSEILSQKVKKMQKFDKNPLF